MDFKFKVDAIKYSNIPETVMQRTPKTVNDLLAKKDFVIDVHTHYFDMQCINKKYFILRMIKDFLGLKSVVEGEVKQIDIENIYDQEDKGQDNWEDELLKQLDNKEIEIVNLQSTNKGIIDILNARKLLTMKSMSDVYWYYLNSFSLAKSFDEVPDDNVLTTVLMMDLEMGWETSIKKKMHDQILEIKKLTEEFPVLPFLACDPRRVEIDNNSIENLYNLFNIAFCEGVPFFGVKIYPAMGYHPSDYRLWPIYEICEKYNIPIVSHNGGEAVSTNQRDFTVFAGKEKVKIFGDTRKEVAYKLNDPNNWEIALNLFPKLKVNLAHFGSNKTWESSTTMPLSDDPQLRKETIISFMKKFDNVYSDFAFTIADIKASKNLKNRLVSDEVIRERTLFGSDFWVISPQGNLHLMQDDFVHILDENFESLDLRTKLCKTNPLKFLFGK